MNSIIFVSKYDEFALLEIYVSCIIEQCMPQPVPNTSALLSLHLDGPLREEANKLISLDCKKYQPFITKSQRNCAFNPISYFKRVNSPGLEIFQFATDGEFEEEEEEVTES